MLNKNDLDRLIDAMITHGVTCLHVQGAGTELRLVLSAAQQAATVSARRYPVCSPCIGGFVSRGTDDGLPPLHDLARVTTGEILGYITQGAVRVLILVPTDGRLVTPAPVVGAIVGYGDPLFEVEAAK